MLTLYAFGNVHPLVHGLTRDLRAQWALEELGIPYEIVGLDHTKGELKSDAYGALSPFHQIPAIDDDGFKLSESAAILLYLAAKAGRIPTTLPGRATLDRWCFATLTTVEPVIQVIGLDDMQGSKDAKRRESNVAWANRGLGGLEPRVAQQEYLVSDDFTVADILLATVLRLARRCMLLADFPALTAYLARCEARPAWHRTLDLYAERLGADRAAIAK